MNKQGLLYHDGSNFWIGVSADGTHHTGSTVISSGSDAKGVKVSKPNGSSRSESYLISSDGGEITGTLAVSKDITVNGSSAYRYIKYLTANDNLDDVKQSGIYHCSTSNMPQNSPFQNAFVLEVCGNQNQTVCIQRATRFGMAGQSKYRAFGDGVWKNWADLAQDSGWITVTPNSNFTTYSTIRYRKLNGIVQLVGALSPATTATLADGADNVVAFTLPEGYRPSSNMDILCQGSLLSIFLFRLKTSGDVAVGRYRDSFDRYPTSVAVSTWLPFSVTFIAT